MTRRARWAVSRLQYEFSDSSLLEQARTHRSASKVNNERLEFLGDALLSFTVAHELYRARHADAEGDLSRARAALVNRSVLAEIGRELGIDEHLILGRGERRAGGSHRSAGLADAVEALIGAVFLDGGYEPARSLILHLMAPRLQALPGAEELKDPKTRLQEWLQARGMSLPTYTVHSVTGRDHQKAFEVHCHVAEDGRQTSGSGASRRRAEQDAARTMLEELSGEA